MPKYGYTFHMKYGRIHHINVMNSAQLPDCISYQARWRERGGEPYFFRYPSLFHKTCIIHGRPTSLLISMSCNIRLIFSWSQRSYKERTVNTLYITHLMGFTQYMKNTFLLTLFNWRVLWLCNHLIQYNIMQMCIFTHYFKFCSNRGKIS